MSNSRPEQEFKDYDKLKGDEKALYDRIHTVDTKGVDVSRIGPDPFWPEGAVPQHLTPGEKQKAMDTGAYDTKPTIVDEPTAAVPQDTSLSQKTNTGWMDVSRQLGLEIFERQPEETDTEWRIWEAYRSYYPNKLPTYSELAAKTGHAPGTVVKAAQKWSFKVRLLDWARFTDAGIQERRVEAIRVMNEKQLKMSTNIMEKLETAISIIDPTVLRPGEIVNLFKVATELQRKVTTYVEESIQQPAIADKTQKQTVNVTKPEDISEVLAILQKAGALDNKQIGIEQTTRLVVKEANDTNEANTNIYS